VTEIIESEGQCRGCGETFVLRSGFCDKCWDKVQRRRQRLLAKGASPAPPPAKVVPEPPHSYYIVRNGAVIEATADEFLAVVAGGRYYK